MSIIFPFLLQQNAQNTMSRLPCQSHRSHLADLAARSVGLTSLGPDPPGTLTDVIIGGWDGSAVKQKNRNIAPKRTNNVNSTKDDANTSANK